MEDYQLEVSQKQGDLIGNITLTVIVKERICIQMTMINYSNDKARSYKFADFLCDIQNKIDTYFCFYTIPGFYKLQYDGVSDNLSLIVDGVSSYMSVDLKMRYDNFAVLKELGRLLNKPKNIEN